MYGLKEKERKPKRGGLIFTVLGLGVYGLFFYMILVIFVGLHNLHVVITIWKRKKRDIFVFLAFFASIWSIFFLFGFFGNFNVYFVLALAHGCAVVYTVKALTISEDTGRLNMIIVVYNGLGAFVVFLKMLSGYGIDFTGVFSGISHTFTLSHSLFEMVNFFFLQIFYPALFIPPILINLKTSQRFFGRLEIKAVKAFAGYTVAFMVVAAVPAVIMLSSFADVPVFAENYHESPLKFGVKMNSFANEAEPMGDWEELLLKEIEIARELGIDYVDFYVDRSYIEDSVKKQRLEDGLKRVRDEGFGVILACMGSNEWIFNPPPLAVHNSIMREDALELAQLHPDYLIVVVEPLARHNGMMLQEPVSVKEWGSIINETALQVKMIDENIKVSVAIAAAEEDGLNLVRNLQTSTLDAIGIDVHPFHADMVDVLYEYAQITHSEKELWVFEFGMETYNFGEETQARYMAYLPKRASELQFSGVVQYDIMDNPHSQLGLVYSSGEKKLGFYAYKNAIERIRGNQPDFSTVLKDKQKENWIFFFVLVLIFSCTLLRKIKTRWRIQ